MIEKSYLRRCGECKQEKEADEFKECPACKKDMCLDCIQFHEDEKGICP